MGKSINVKDVCAERFVKAYAQHLKKEGKIRIPIWSEIVKTGQHKQLSPTDPDWFYIRTASIARSIYLRPGGVGHLRHRFGGGKQRTVAPLRHIQGSARIPRVIVQELEKLGVLEKSKTG
jgi:small subunit ribosomal protein S19e